MSDFGEEAQKIINIPDSGTERNNVKPKWKLHIVAADLVN